jgi:hypothetical protein
MLQLGFCKGLYRFGVVCAGYSECVLAECMICLRL